MNVHDAVLHHCRAQDDASVHGAVGAEIAYGARIDRPTFLLLELIDDFHRPNLGRARQGSGRQPGCKRVDRIQSGANLALDVGDEMHDVAVSLYEEAVCHAHVAS